MMQRMPSNGRRILACVVAAAQQWAYTSKYVCVGAVVISTTK
jgi:hypothetical protein